MTDRNGNTRKEEFKLPFRLVGITVEGLFQLIRAIFLLPSRVQTTAPDRIPSFRNMNRQSTSIIT
jgi:hypothetical protein